MELDDDEPATAVTVAIPATARPSIVARLWPVAAGVVLTAVVTALLSASLRRAPDAKVTRLSVLAPPGTSLYPESSSVAISPDGTMVAFIVSSVNLSDSQLWVRSLDRWNRAGSKEERRSPSLSGRPTAGASASSRTAN